MKYVIITLFSIFVLIATAQAELLKEHNEQHTAERTAREHLWSQGCTRFDSRRREGFKVYSQDGAVRITGNAIDYFCTEYETEKTKVQISWNHPKQRADGSELLESEITGYEMNINGEIINVPAAEKYIFELAAGAYEVKLRTKTLGQASKYSEIIRFEI